MQTRLSFVLCCLLASAGFTLAGAAVDEPVSPREPFVLELPDLNLGDITEPTTIIASAEVHKIRFRIKEPFASSIEYNKIYTSVNGEAAGPIQMVGSAANGKVVTCDLDRLARFKLKSGKNVVEVKAINRQNQTFYASYVLIRSSAVSSFLGRPEATIVNQSVSSGSDQAPPGILIQSPKGPLTVVRFPATVQLSGLVTDNSEKVACLKINQKTVPLETSQGRKLVHTTPLATTRSFFFSATVQVESTSPMVVIQAVDGSGNEATLTLPVLLQPEKPAAPEIFAGQKYALCIGISKYRNSASGIPNLQFAHSDARALRDFLMSAQGGGFRRENIVLLEDTQATLANVREALKRLALQAGPTDLVFLFLAGHGSPDPKARFNLYYIMHDSHIEDLAHTALPMVEVQDLLNKQITAKRVIAIVDTCHSSGMYVAVGSRSLENNLVNLYATKLFAGTGRAVLTSSDVNEESKESTAWGNGHGVFTWALLDGLQGAADADNNRLVTTNELFVYTRAVVQNETGYSQNPRAFEGNNGDLVLSVVK